jgi:hypothetical protein
LILTSKPNRRLFNWIEEKSHVLDNDPDGGKEFFDFTAVLQTHMRDIANSEYTLEMEKLKQKKGRHLVWISISTAVGQSKFAKLYLRI